MAYLEWLEKALGGAIAEKRIGTPVALRAFFQLSDDHGVLAGALAQQIELAARWLGARPSRLFAQGGAAAGYVSALVEFGGGQTALIASETLRGAKPLVTVLLIGNHGTLRYDDSPPAAAFQPKATPLRRDIERSLESGAPVAVQHGG